MKTNYLVSVLALYYEAELHGDGCAANWLTVDGTMFSTKHKHKMTTSQSHISFISTFTFLENRKTVILYN